MNALVLYAILLLRPYVTPILAEFALELVHRLRTDPAFIDSLDQITDEYKKAQESGDKEKRLETLKSFQRLIAGRS